MLDLLKITNVAVNVQAGATVVSTASVGDLAIHKNTYLGDADGNGIYTGFDSALVVRVVVGLDSGFDAHTWTDPVIVADVVGSGKLTGIDTTLIAQKSVGLPTPQIPVLPGIPLVPNGGGGSLALDEPQTASTTVVANPTSGSAIFTVASTTTTSEPTSIDNTTEAKLSIRSAPAQWVFAAYDEPTNVSPPAPWTGSDFADLIAARPGSVPSAISNGSDAVGGKSSLDNFFATMDDDSSVAVERDWLNDEATENGTIDDCFDLVADRQ